LEIGSFMWKHIILVTSLYLLLAITMISFTYPKADLHGLVAPPGFKATFYNSNPMIAVFSSGSSTHVYWADSVYSLGSPASSTCYDGSKLLMIVGGELYTVDSTGLATRTRFSLDARLATVTCGETPYAILTSNTALLLVDTSRGVGFRLEGLPLDGVSISGLQVGGGVYVASGNRVVFVNGSSTATIYELPGAAVVRGLALSHEGLVAYGSWDDMGLVYRFSVGEAILLKVPGRVTSVDALSCYDYRCWAIVRPHGDWLIVVEFNNWRYVSHARIVAVKPFVYHTSGASDRAWISGDLVDLGVVVLGVMSTREAVVGFNGTHAVLYTEGYITPTPRLSKIKVYPHTERVKVDYVEVELLESSEVLQRGDSMFKTVEPQIDRLATLTTLMVVTMPVLVYAYSYARGRY
jgi:hypothetical protein